MLTRFAPLLFVLLWSSSFVSGKTGLRFVSPLLFVAVRLAGCAVVLLVLMLVLRRAWRPIAGRQGLHCAVAGILLNGIGLMSPHIGLTMVPAAHIAIVQSLTPLATAALGTALLRERLRAVQWLGLVLGIAGTLYFGRFCRAVPLLQGATAQFVPAALFAALGAWLLETPRADWTGLAIGATAWNTMMVSLGGMGLYAAMLARGTAARTSANFYLVPGTAALMAWLVLGEALAPQAIAGLLVASLGCWLVNRAPRT